MQKAKLKNKQASRKNKKIFFFLFLFIFNITMTFHYLLSKNINISDKYLFHYLLKHSNYAYDDSTKEKNILRKFIDQLSVIDLINFNYYSLKKKEVVKKTGQEVLAEKKDDAPLIYIYNSHQGEEYKEVDIAYNIKPTVTINNYIMKDVFEQNQLPTLVEERSIKEVLSLNQWNYARSYQASRVFLEDVLTTNPSLKYFIDVHRDSLPHDKTTVTIGDKNYAKVIFLIGMENENYAKNLALTERINQKIEAQYSGLSKGIYKKGGPGVNGVYNQDFSENTILIEIGGTENTIEEVMNTTLVLSNILSEVIKENEG